eukprot:1159010-Pelagomonas_calceolata.AAC.9
MPGLKAVGTSISCSGSGFIFDSTPLRHSVTIHELLHWNGEEQGRDLLPTQASTILTDTTRNQHEPRVLRWRG